LVAVVAVVVAGDETEKSVDFDIDTIKQLHYPTSIYVELLPLRLESGTGGVKRSKTFYIQNIYAQLILLIRTWLSLTPPPLLPGP
jgi:hypothetical protein